MSRRITWIDCWKGIAIAIVVAGHILDLKVAKYIFWFHMPLFFFISGYLYKEKHDYLSFFKNKFLHLIVPYISFLILFSLPTLITSIVEIWHTKKLESLYQLLLFSLHQLYGGELLVNDFGIFWFFTCLFFTQQLYNFIYTQFGSYKWLINIIMLDAYCLAMIDNWFFKDIIYPWNINVVLMALPFFWLGHIMSQQSNNFHYGKFPIIAIITLLILVIIDNYHFIEFSFNMKHKSYGLPIINLFIAASGILIIQKMAIVMSKIKIIDAITREIGAASIAIMYLHQPIQISFKQISFLNEGIVRLIAGLLIPYIIYKIIINFPLTRKYFLGEFKSISNLKLRSLSKV